MRKFMQHKYVLLIIMVVLIISGCSSKQNTNFENSNDTNENETVELTISAAASLTNALKNIQKAYETNHKSIKLNFNFGASGSLQQQIEQGAPVDLFISAAPKNMNTLIEKQLIHANQHTTLLTNELVLIIPSDASTKIHNLNDLTKSDIKKIAIGIPESVPAGNYAKEALSNLTLWDALQDKTVQAKDVRQVLQYVETGNVDAGFVYKTDALTSSDVKIAFSIQPSLHTSIEYPIGIVSTTKYKYEAQNFYEYVLSKEALAIFEQYGFSESK